MEARLAPSGPYVAAMPEPGSFAGWPLVLYFHHCSWVVDHYTALTPQDFARGLDLVLDLFEPLNPHELPRTPTTGTPKVLITLDDGYADNYEYAAPILESRGVRALFFVITGRLRDGQPARAFEPEPRYLRWSQVEDLAHRGHAIGAHSETHPRLPELPDEQQAWEIHASLRDVAERLGGPCRTFAHPYGLPPTSTAAIAALDGCLAFGTVKDPPTPWSEVPWNIRRTYLTAGGSPDQWRELVSSWRRHSSL